MNFVTNYRIRGIRYSSNSGDRLFTSDSEFVLRNCGEIDCRYSVMMKGSEL